MKTQDQKDLLARLAICLMVAQENDIKIPKEICNHTGWYLTYSTGRDKQWQEMANRTVEFVSNKLNESKEPTAPTAPEKA